MPVATARSLASRSVSLDENAGGTGAETLLFLAAAALFVGLELLVLRGGILFTRPLWLDEIHTALIAGTPTLGASLRSLAAGADFNPPTVYLLYRLVGDLAGGASEPWMRTVSLACVLGAMASVYALLRRDVGRWGAAMGALAVWAQTVVVSAAFEARFYGPWLLATGLFLIALRRVHEDPSRSRAAAAWLATAAVALCTVHYFGILSWGVAILVVLVRGRRTTVDVVRRVLPAVAGPVALLTCVPLYLRQRAALTAPTWMPNVSVADVLFLLAVLLVPPSTLVGLVCAVVGRVRARTGVAAAGGLAMRDAGLGPWLLVGQAAVPVGLAALSLAGQPFTQPRYWIVGALAAAPIAGSAVARCGRMLAWVVVAVTLGWSVVTIQTARGQALAHSARVREDVEIVSELTHSGLPIVVRRRHTLYPIVRVRPDLQSKVAVLDATSAHPGERFLAVERDVAMVHQREFGFPRIVTLRDLRSVPSFYMIEFSTDSTPPAAEFPGRTIHRVRSRVFLVDR